MELPLVSVIVPTYNRPGELCECIEALSRQTYSRFEIIVVNDCGDEVEFLKKLYPELPLILIRMESNQKHVHARNRALMAATGEYVLLCDDDDLLLPNHLELMMKEIEGYDLVHSDVEIVSYRHEGGRRIPFNRILFAYTSTLEQMRQFSTFVSSGCLYRRSIHDEIGGFDAEVLNYWDWDFYLRAAERFRCKRVPVASVLYAFSEGGGHASAEIDDRRQRYLDRLCMKHGLGSLPQKNFLLLLDEPEVMSRKAETLQLWDGVVPVSRYSPPPSQVML
jgi:glycosyltransferase involved in cell wall biosynthesis